MCHFHSLLYLMNSIESDDGYQNSFRNVYQQPTQFLGNPVKAEGELLDLDDQVVGERGKAGGSGK